MGFLKNLFKKSEYRAVETIEIDEHLRQIMGLVTDTQTALNIPAVSACVDFISSKIAELPIKLYHEKDGKTAEIVKDIRLVLLNDSTGDLLDSYQMKKAFVRDYLLHGAGYIFPERNGNEFISLRFIANENVTVTKNYDPIYKVARYQIGTRTFFDDEIMRICRNTKDGVTGIGIIQEHADILNAAYKQIVYERYLVERGGNKKGFIQVDDRVTQEVLDDLKEKWRTLYSSDNSNMMVLNKGLKFVESSNTSVEMQLNESKDTNNELICEMFGLSSKVISGTASDEEYISAIKTAVMPIVSAIQTALNKSMLLWAEKSDHYFILDTKELLKGDILKRYQAYQIALKEGFLQLDEVRYEEDKEPYGLQFIKLGLQDVLFDPKTRTIYTPNTNQTAVLGEKSVDKSDENAIIEERDWGTIHGQHVFIGVSAKGANKFAKGFQNKQKRNNHFSKHKSEYIDDNITTAEQYEKRALSLAQSSCNETILGYKNAKNEIVRYDSLTNDFVKGNPDKHIFTMFKPCYDEIKKGNKKAGLEYFLGELSKEGIEKDE